MSPEREGLDVGLNGADATSAVRMSPEREGLDVGLNGADVHALGLGPLRKQGRIVDPLRARDDLLPTDEHVVRVGVPGVIRRRHRVKRPGRERVAVQNVKVRLVLLLDEPSQGPLHLGRQVVKGVLVDAVLLEQLHALLKGEPEGWPQVLQRLEGVLLVGGLQLLLLVLQAVEHVHEELIDHVQELEVVLLDRHLEVHADELAQVAVGEGLFRAKDGADLKDSPEIRADGHLLAELRGLRQAGVALHVLELEDGGPALARAGHDLGRVDLHKVLGQQVLPEELAHGGLDAEDGLVRGVLRSMKRLSSLVSWLTWAPSASSRLHASAISKGSGAALETTNIPVPWISTCLMVHPSSGELGTTATPVTSTTLSLLTLVTYLTIPLLTTFCSLSTKKTHCTVAVRSLSTTKADLPFPRTA